MQQYIEKAANLVEAFPYIREFYGKTMVIKYGGAAMTDATYIKNVMRDIALLHFCGIRVVIIHGGGPEISDLCERLKIPVRFAHGQRITDEKTLEVVQMSLLGKINTTLVAELNQHGVKAVGISGHDAAFLQAKKLAPKESTDDLGFVGDVEKVDTHLITSLLTAGFLPVISPIGRDTSGQSYNINADTVASNIAGAISAEKLVLLSDVNGLYADKNNPETRIGSLDVATVNEWTKDGRITGGMIPKMNACVHALVNGVKRVHILDGKIQHSLLLEIFTDQGIGTMVTR
jgi:acetylglutamate kinase